MGLLLICFFFHLSLWSPVILIVLSSPVIQPLVSSPSLWFALVPLIRRTLDLRGPAACCFDKLHSSVWTTAERSFCSPPGTCTSFRAQSRSAGRCQDVPGRLPSWPLSPKHKHFCWQWTWNVSSLWPWGTWQYNSKAEYHKEPPNT